MRVTFKSFDKMEQLSNLKRSRHQRNKHPKAQIARLAQIMKEHGVRHPIHVSRQSGEVCFGHGRWAAALLNGYTEYPIVYQDFSSDLEEYACVQSDNAIAAWAELDLPLINEDILKLGPEFDVNLLGIEDLTDGTDIEAVKEADLPEAEWIVSVFCQSETELQELYEELRERNFNCKLIT